MGVEATRLKNRLHSALDLAWPEFVEQFAGLDFDTPNALLERWPTATDLAAAAPKSVHTLVRKASRNHISAERIRAMLERAHATIALTEGTTARRDEITRLLARWRVVRAQIVDVERRLAELVEMVPAAKVLTTIPSVSVVCAATIVAELGDPRWYEAPRQVLKLAGMNLARKESGTSVKGRLRQTKRGRPLLRRQLFLLAGRWCQTKGLYREYYEAMLARGKPRTSAVCAVARKLVPMLLKVMHTGEPFDLARWRENRMEESPYRAA